jgi:hypothetical protein
MRRALIVLSALLLNASLMERAWAAQACAWIVESVEDGGAHKFALNLSVNAPTSLAVRFGGPGFTSVSMGGEIIQLNPGAPQEVDAEGVDLGDFSDLHFDVQLFKHSLASMEELQHPTGKPLATFAFDRKAGERAPPAAFAKQCKPLG